MNNKSQKRELTTDGQRANEEGITPDDIRDCGPNCQCSTCAGCISWGRRCVFIPKQALKAADPLASIKLPTNKLSLQDNITINVSKMSLADVGLFLGGLSRDEIGVPAKLLRGKVSIKVKNKPLSEVLEKLGLVKLPKKSGSKSIARQVAK